MRKGSFGVGVFHPKKEENIGGLMSSAWLYGASYVFTIGKRYGVRQSSDTPNVLETLPVFHYKTFAEFHDNLPINAELIGIELDQLPI